MYASQCSFGDYLRLAASIHHQPTSPGHTILVTSSSAWEDPEVNRRRMAPPFDVQLIASLCVWVWVWVPR
jgi:hypothetical protein